MSKKRKKKQTALDITAKQWFEIALEAVQYQKQMKIKNNGKI